MDPIHDWLADSKDADLSHADLPAKAKDEGEDNDSDLGEKANPREKPVSQRNMPTTMMPIGETMNGRILNGVIHYGILTPGG